MARRRRRVINVHDQPTDTGTYLLVSEHTTDPNLLSMAPYFETSNVVVVTDNKFLLSHVPEIAVTAEFARGRENQLVERNVEQLRAYMHAMASGEEMPPVDPAQFTYYERVVEIKTELAQRLGFVGMQRLEPFEEMPDWVLERLQEAVPKVGQPGRYIADYWNRDSSHKDWFGSIVRKRDSPFQAAA